MLRAAAVSASLFGNSLANIESTALLLPITDSLHCRTIARHLSFHQTLVSVYTKIMRTTSARQPRLCLTLCLFVNDCIGLYRSLERTVGSGIS